MCRVPSAPRNAAWVSTSMRITELTCSSETMPRPWSGTRNFHPFARSTNIIFRFFISGVFYQCGFFLEYLFGSLTDWRTAAGISASIPIFTAIYVALVLYLTFHILLNSRNFLNCREWSAEWNGRISTDRYESSILIQCHQCSEISIDLDVKYALFFYQFSVRFSTFKHTVFWVGPHKLWLAQKWHSLLTILPLREVFPRFVSVLFRRPKLSDSLSSQFPTSTMLWMPVLGMRNCEAFNLILNSMKMGNYFKDWEGIEHSQRGNHIRLTGLKIMSSDTLFGSSLCAEFRKSMRECFIRQCWFIEGQTSVSLRTMSS